MEHPGLNHLGTIHTPMTDGADAYGLGSPVRTPTESQRVSPQQTSRVEGLRRASATPHEDGEGKTGAAGIADATMFLPYMVRRAAQADEDISAGTSARMETG